MNMIKMRYYPPPHYTKVSLTKPFGVYTTKILSKTYHVIGWRFINKQFYAPQRTLNTNS